jgi:hypothetical protein
MKIEWRETNGPVVVANGNPYRIRDFRMVAKAGEKEIFLFHVSDLTDGHWMVTSRYIPTRIAGSRQASPERARAAAEEALRGYADWVAKLVATE